MARPMSAGVHIEMSPRRIRAVFHGKTITDSSRASLVWRTGWPPVPWYYEKVDITVDGVAQKRPKTGFA